jgi:hypothetical protein
MVAWRLVTWTTLLAASFVTCPREATADEPARRVRFEYQAAPECPLEKDFLANVAEKTELEVVASTSQATRTFAITLKRAAGGGGYRGQLVVRRPSGRESTRQLAGVSCREVAEAIAVIVAIELGPEQEPETEPPATRVSAPRPAPLPAPAPRAKAGWRWGGLVGLGMTSALASSPSPEARLFLAARREATGLVAPDFRAGLTYVDGTRVDNTGGALELRLFGAALEACPIRARLSRRFSLEPCAKALLALRVASGGPPSNPDAQTGKGWWVDVGGLLRALLAVSDPVWLDLSLEGFVPLVRDRFYTFAPQLTVFQTPSAGARVALGVGLVF